MAKKAAVTTEITQIVRYDEFTDGGATIGTFALSDTIPAGATVLFATVTNVTGFIGDVSAVMNIGDGVTTGRYNTGPIDIFTTVAAGISGGIVSGTRYHNLVANVILTVTTATDFTKVTDGSFAIKIVYVE